MKALTFAGRTTVRCESVSDPEIQDPTDVIVRTRLSAICGSDLHVYNERERGLDPGTTLGHELVGEIAEVGRDVKTLKREDLVVSPFTTSCGACFFCLKGLTSRCSLGQLFGWVQDGKGLQGTQAEYVRVPLADSTLLVLPEEVDPEEGLFLGDVLSTGYSCAEVAGIEPGSTCAVIGCGPVGIMAVLGAGHLGAEKIFAIDSVPERLDLARRFGALPINYKEEDLLETIREATDGRGVDAALELVGNHAASRTAVDVVRTGGIISVAGVHTGGELSFSPVEAYDRNLTYKTGRCPARYYMDRLLPLVRQKRYPLASVISHRVPLREGVRAYDIFDKKLDRCTKVVLTP